MDQTLFDAGKSKREVERGNSPLKGLRNGRCNRTACQAPLIGQPQSYMSDHETFTADGKLYYCLKCTRAFDQADIDFGNTRRCTVIAELTYTKGQLPNEYIERDFAGPGGHLRYTHNNFEKGLTRTLVQQPFYRHEGTARWFKDRNKFLALVSPDTPVIGNTLSPKIKQLCRVSELIRAEDFGFDW